MIVNDHHIRMQFPNMKEATAHLNKHKYIVQRSMTRESTQAIYAVYVGKLEQTLADNVNVLYEFQYHSQHDGNAEVWIHSHAEAVKFKELTFTKDGTQINE